jgi:hypothetical protein
MLLLTALVGLSVWAQSADKLYEEGKKLYDAKDYAAAVPKLRTAAEKGHKKAQYRLGRCYAKGHGISEDDQVAVQWYAKSAAQGYAKAEYRLGRAYFKGKGIAVDKKLAKKWLSRAVAHEKSGKEILADLRKDAAEGDEDAKAMLALIGKK